MKLEIFRKITEKYNDFYQSFYEKGTGTVADTEKGIWGPAGTQDVYDFFVKIKLQNFKHFLDLGSGDGKVVLIASLFTDATGIEFDKELNDFGLKVKKELKLKCNLIQDDFFKYDFSKYDIIFINPDQGFHKGLEEKLVKEMQPKAKLFIYNNIFQPLHLKKGKTYWFNGIPIISYTK